MSSKVVFHVMCRACFVSGNSDDDECVKVKVECRLRASSGRGRGGAHVPNVRSLVEG